MLKNLMIYCGKHSIYYLEVWFLDGWLARFVFLKEVKMVKAA